MSDPHVPPNDLEAEESVIGAVLMSELAHDALDLLSPFDFYRPAHEHIWNAILDVREAGQPIDAVTVMGKLREYGILDDVGGAPYLHTLVVSTPTAANATHYAKIVLECSKRRAIIRACTLVVQEAYGGEAGSDVLLEKLTQGTLAVQTRAGHTNMTSMKDALDQALENMGEEDGLMTGFRRLDSMLDGLKAGQLILIAGRPGMGKTALALNIAATVAMAEGLPVAFFSLEMSQQELAIRLLSSEARVDSSDIRKGNLSPERLGRVQDAAARLMEAPLYIDDTAIITPGEIRARARALQAEIGDLGLIVVDYLQLMGGESENRVQEVAQISRGLKILAKDLKVPVIAASQLSRANEHRERKKPRLSDLRDSGALEQDADVVVFLYRAGVYDDEADPSEAEIIVEKNRNGPVGSVPAFFQAAWTSFTEGKW